MTATGGSDEEGSARGWRATFHRHWHWAKWPVEGVGVLVLIGLIGFLWLWFTVKLPADLPPVQSSVVVDAQGRPLATFGQNGLREPVTLDKIAPVAVDALLSAEDRHFFDHHGVDPGGLVRAMWHDVRGDSLQGGSTITQQLVKNSYLNSDRSVGRKAKEAVLAMKLEQTHDKHDILDRYFNVVYFGRGAYGIQAASHVYFNTTADQLNTNQAAFLIGLLRSPETADPSRNPDVAKQRRDHVIDAMVDNHKLSASDAAAVKQQDIGAVARVEQTQVTSGIAPWFVDYVREQAVAQFGESAVYGGGLRITTTLDLDDQKAAEDAVAQVLNQPDDPQAAVVALDKSGAIRAYVGGRDYNALKVDLARGAQGGGSGRQAGSTFKPFVLAANAEQGKTARQVFPAPGQITLPTSSGPWTVSNYGGEAFGATDLIDGTVHSVNTVYAQLVLQVGPDKAAALAHAAGIQSDLPVEPSLTLGTGDVSPLEMADAYLTFAREGQRVEPFAIANVQDRNGRTLFDANPKTSTAMKPDTAHLVDFVLQQVIARGTGTAAKLDRPVAGKTGTTENSADAWFAGYTPDYAAVVWMGYPEGNAKPMANLHGVSTVTGGTLPAQIWKKFMDGALTDVPKDEFPKPPDALLAPPDMTASLTVTPANGDPGTTITAAGSGFAQCVAGWYVTAGSARSSPQAGSTDDRRSTTLTIAADAPPGTIDVQAYCDVGAGAQAVAHGTFTVNGPTTTSTSTTNPPSTTSPSTTTTASTTTTTTTTSTTTTTPN